ncbi:MAG: hypothetical protein HYV92_06185 [Candidatus Rokubacteria bacterium]|nr:hypothetical protein [Candidatus Rokubacteria bacterium]MBI2554003.1 hypothetical protein [Candidatus Rokubacteria bacterium]
MSTCECGMTHDQASSRLGCSECGTVLCRSCLIKVDANTFCRWCAPTAGVGGA